MKVRVPLLVQDPLSARLGQTPVVERFDIAGEPFFLDGPVTERVAVIDLAPDGTRRPGARFVPPPPGRVLGRYDVADESNVLAHDLQQVSVFATVLKAMRMFEEPDTLGRRLTWAFGAPQLLIVPDAGRWANAFYERDSHSLQFFAFPNPADPTEMIHTCLSRDIVSHEAGHAILDGIAPDLYSALTPQSLALHEAIADLTALMMAFRSNALRSATLKRTGGSIRESTAFSSLAEQFGGAIARGRRRGYLRSLLNEKTLNPADTSRDENGEPNRVARDRPYDLSQVLSGALYKLMVDIHERLRAQLAQREGITEYSASGKALAVGSERFKRIVLRALDYLPPGEISFVDYGRAIIAADQASHPDDPYEREWLANEFVRRHMVPDAQALTVETDYPCSELDDIDLESLVASDWVAYDLVNRNRDLLHVPEGIPFRIPPRLDVKKRYYLREGPKEIRECILKVAWDVTEDNPLTPRYPGRRQITLGTTLAIDSETHRVRALLTTAQGAQPGEHAQGQADRTAMLATICEEGLLAIGQPAAGSEDLPLQSVIRAERSAGVLRVHGTARMLEIAGGIG